MMTEIRLVKSLKEKLMILLDKAETIEDIEYLESKLSTTNAINRRTKDGRLLIAELKRYADQVIKHKGILPFWYLWKKNIFTHRGYFLIE